jgi:hypothetical protein
MHVPPLETSGKMLLHQKASKRSHTSPTDAATARIASSLVTTPAVEHATPRALHTCEQLWEGSPRYHCGATVAVADGAAPTLRLAVGV